MFFIASTDPAVFHSALKTFLLEKSPIYFSGLVVLLNIRRSNQTLYRYRCR